MSPAFLATVGNALVHLPLATSPYLPLRPVPHLRGLHGFRPWRPTTKLTERDIQYRFKKISPCPPYPYGPRHTFKEADEGLYGGAQLQSGNKISRGKNKGKTRRRWYPNVRLESIRSEALNKTLTIPITASCMRTIRKCGGLDQYLLGDKPARIKELGLFGWQLRWRVINSSVMREKYRKERENLGLPPLRPRFESFEEVWSGDEELRAEIQNEQEKQWQKLREKDDKFRQHVKSRFEPKDKTEYEVPVIVPPLDRAVFDSLLPQPEVLAQEDAAQ